MSIQDTSEHRSSRWLGLGWHWLWFIPLCVVVLTLIERHTVINAISLLRLYWHRWDWGGMISPSSGFFLIVLANSVFVPFGGLCAVALLVSARQRPRYPVLLIIVGILALPFITDTLMWGSFPFIYDSHGVARLRMIPFIPWPSGQYGQY